MALFVTRQQCHQSVDDTLADRPFLGRIQPTLNVKNKVCRSVQDVLSLSMMDWCSIAFLRSWAGKCHTD